MGEVTTGLNHAARRSARPSDRTDARPKTPRRIARSFQRGRRSESSTTVPIRAPSTTIGHVIR